MEVAFAGGAIAKEGAGDLLLAAILGRPGEASGVKHLCADRHSDRRGVVLAWHCVAAFVTHPVQKNRFHRDAAPEEAAVLAVAGDEPILLVERVSGTQTGGLLPHVLRVGTHATGTLKAKGNIVKATTREHGLVELDEVGVRDETLAELLVEVPMLVENRDARNLGLKGGGDGHRSRSLDHRGRMVTVKPRTRWLKSGAETRNYCRDIWTLPH